MKIAEHIQLQKTYHSSNKGNVKFTIMRIDSLFRVGSSMPGNKPEYYSEYREARDYFCAILDTELPRLHNRKLVATLHSR